MFVVDGVTTVFEAPPGYVVDFDNPQRSGVPDAYYISGFGTALSMILFAQRMYVKMALSGGLQMDDYLLILALITGYATIGISLHSFASGAGGVHAWEISIEQYGKYMVDVYIAAFLYPISGSFAKLSLLVFYLRLSPQRWFRIAIWITIGVITAYTLAIAIPLIFSCKPMAKAWDIRVEGGTCLSVASLYIATAVTNIISDIVLFVLPIPMVYNLQIPTRQKIGLVSIFGVGSMTVITSIVRVSILPELLSSQDGPWLVAKATVWTLVEGNLIIICASLPTLRKFFRHVAPKLIGESRYGSNKKSQSYPNTNGQPQSRTLVPTSQSRRDRHQYSQFDGENALGNDTYVMGPMQAPTDRSGDEAAATGWGDSDSEKAIITGGGGSPNGILQTTTIRVDVEDIGVVDGARTDRPNQK